ncbi:MAG: hypothetical protein ACM3NH_04435 [Candidatus Saccharibacteria bacterium]
MAIFVVLAVIYTWPLCLHMTELYPSLQSIGGSNDPSFFLGYIDQVARGIAGRNPVPTETMVFYPRGIDMLGAYDGPLMFLVAVPADLLSHNPVLAYNLVLLFSFLFTAWATYFLLRQLVDSWGLSVFGGAVYGFSPYMLIRGVGHLNLMMLGVVPLLALVALKFCRKPTLKGAVLLFGAVILTALSSWYYALAGVLFVGLIFLFRWRILWQAKFLSAVAVIFIGLGLFVVAVPLLTSENKGSEPMTDDFAFRASTQIQNLFLPTPMNPMLGQLTMPVYEKFPTVIFPAAPNFFEMTSYLGLTGLIAILAVILGRKLMRKDIWFWAVSGMVFLILSFGPYVFLFHHRVLLPFYFLRRVYPFDLFRVPNRFFVITLLCAVVLAVYMLDYLRHRVASARLRLLLMVSLSLLIFLDTSMLPYPLMNFPVSQFYKNIADDGGGYAIADLPINEFAVYNYFQTVHHKPIVDGHFFYPGVVPMTYFFININPLLYNSMCQKPPGDPVGQPKSALKLLSEADVKYVVVHNLIIHSQPECDKAGQYIRKFFAGKKPYYSDGDITVYSTDSQ